jgi:hypothetical protein
MPEVLREGGRPNKLLTLVEAMGRALDAVLSAQDARGFFGHCGYRSVGQPL